MENNCIQLHQGMNFNLMWGRGCFSWLLVTLRYTFPHLASNFPILVDVVVTSMAS